MGIVNFILNLVGLLLWLNWRSNRVDPLVKRLPATLMGTLRPAAPKKFRRWHFPAVIVLLLLLRALIYWWVGGGTNWSGELNLGVTVLWFSTGSHWLGLYRMVCFSFLSFSLLLGIVYMWLLLLSLLAGPLPVQAMVTIPLGRVDRWPRWARITLPFFVAAIAWWLATWLLNQLGVIALVPMAGRFQQSVLFGLSSYLLWQYPLGALLLLHLLNSYVYFGKHPFWKYVGATAQTIQQPLGRLPLRLGKVDLAPAVGIAAVFLIAHFAETGLYRLYNHLLL